MLGGPGCYQTWCLLCRCLVHGGNGQPPLLASTEAKKYMTWWATCRLAVYPEYVAKAGLWLDGGSGRASVAAATLRLADAHGLARASAWSPGLAGSEREPRVHAPGQGAGPLAREPSAGPSGAERDMEARRASGAAASSSSGGTGAVLQQGRRHRANPGINPGRNPSIHPAQPPLRPSAGSWAVVMARDGLLVGAARPPARPDVAALLAAVLDCGHELSEGEIDRLFSARGADFDAVCAAAGTPCSRFSSPGKAAALTTPGSCHLARLK